MGQFSGKFVEAAKRAADLLEESLYATYYGIDGIDYAAVRKLPEVKETAKRGWFWQSIRNDPDAFALLCASRAGVPLGQWDPAINGMIIEQQQILTTQNLAALFVGLDVADVLRGQSGEMARQCFRWICRRLQMKTDQWHARLITLKNTAYAWRQMVFFISLLPFSEVAGFLRWAEDHLNGQSEAFQTRFRPVWKGLALAAKGHSPDSEADARRFLGWSKTRHWLLPEAESR
jgi:hypothetical protein